MEQFSSQPVPIKTSDALMQIGAVEQQVMTTGRVDSERTAIHDIRTKLYRNEITPEEAIQLLDHLVSRRQDYN